MVAFSEQLAVCINIGLINSNVDRRMSLHLQDEDLSLDQTVQSNVLPDRLVFIEQQTLYIGC